MTLTVARTSLDPVLQSSSSSPPTEAEITRSLSQALARSANPLTVANAIPSRIAIGLGQLPADRQNAILDAAAAQGGAGTLQAAARRGVISAGVVLKLTAVVSDSVREKAARPLLAGAVRLERLAEAAASNTVAPPDVRNALVRLRDRALRGETLPLPATEAAIAQRTLTSGRGETVQHGWNVIGSATRQAAQRLRTEAKAIRDPHAVSNGVLFGQFPGALQQTLSALKVGGPLANAVKVNVGAAVALQAGKPHRLDVTQIDLTLAGSIKNVGVPGTLFGVAKSLLERHQGEALLEQLKAHELAGLVPDRTVEKARTLLNTRFLLNTAAGVVSAKLGAVVSEHWAHLDEQKVEILFEMGSYGAERVVDKLVRLPKVHVPGSSH